MADNYHGRTLRPTILIGLGGSGHKVLVNLKARLVDQFGATAYQSAVQFLAIDTAAEKPPASQPNHPDQDSVTLAQDEILRISRVSIYEMMQEIKSQPQKGQQQNSGHQHLSPMLQRSHIDQGAQQVRRLGRIALFYRSKEVLENLEGKIQALMTTNRAGANDASPTIEPDGVRIFVIGSICGGTGSGTFIDIAYLTRHLMGLKNFSRESFSMVGLFFLPEVFDGKVKSTGRQRIRANAFAALLDMEYYNRDEIGAAPLYREHFGTEVIESYERPYHLCYLVTDTTATSDKDTLPFKLEGMDNLAPVMADALLEMITSNVGTQLDATLDNVKIITTRYHRDGHRRLYSALGFAALSYPHTWFEHQVAQRLQAKIVGRYILNDEDKRASEVLRQAAARTVYQAAPQADDHDVQCLEQFRDQVREVLLPDGSNNEAVKQALTALDRFKDYTSRAGVTVLSEQIRDVLQQVREAFDGTIRQEVEDREKEASSQLQDELEKELNRHLEGHLQNTRERGGFVWARHWLLKVRECLSEVERQNKPGNWQGTLRQRQDELISHLETQQRQWRAWLAGGVKLDETKWAEIRQVFEADALGQLLQASLVSVFKTLQPLVAQWLQELDETMSFWRVLKEEAARSSHAARPPHFSPFVHLVMSEDRDPQQHVEKLTDDILNRESFLDDLRATLNQVAADNQTTAYLERSLNREQRAALKGALVRFARSQYHSKQTVADQLRGMEDKQRDEWLNTLQRQSRVLLAYRENELKDYPPPTFRVVGTRNATTDAARVLKTLEDESDTSLVTTKNRELIVMLETQHGLPLSALQGYHIYKETYKQLVREPNAIFHLSEALERAPYNPSSLYFVDGQSLRLLFGRALAYEWITFDRQQKCFVLEATFAQRWGEQITAQIEELQRETTRKPDSEVSDEIRMRFLEDEIDALKIIRKRLIEQKDGRIYYPAGQNDQNDQPARLLQEALIGLTESPLMTLGHTFQTAFQGRMNESFGQGSPSEEVFLQRFLKKAGVTRDEQGRPQIKILQTLSESGNDQERALQRSLIYQLLAYETMAIRDRRLTDDPYYWR